MHSQAEDRPTSRASNALAGITLTGIGPEVPTKILVDLAKQFPQLEWGVLLSRKQAGQGRYPDWGWIQTIADLCAAGKLRAALHVCGSAVSEFLHEPQTGSVFVLANHFTRIQLNFAHEISAADLNAAIAMCKVPVITQQNAQNDRVNAQITAANHELLFDKSCGRGLSPTHWPAPIPGKRCGYAGGLSPDNLSGELARIAAVCAPGTWIDIEGKLRSDQDTFSSALAAGCLQVFSKFQSSAPG